MALSNSSCFFNSSKFAVDPHSPSLSPSSISLRYGRRTQSPPISATTTTTTADGAAETVRASRIAANSLYEVLGIQIGADTEEIKAAYRRLARVLHPDAGKCESSADEFMKVHSAYVTLSDPGKRADYDRNVIGRKMTAVRASSQARCNGYSGRRWETDQCW